MNDRVEFLGLERRTEMRVEPDAYRVREERPAVWLQRLCCWILAKLGAVHEREMVDFVRIPIDGKTFMHRVQQQKLSLDFVYRYKAERLLIGAEDYHELMGSPEILEVIRFNAPYSAMEYGQRRILGLEVVVVPWMRGVVVMPHL